MSPERGIENIMASGGVVENCWGACMFTTKHSRIDRLLLRDPPVCSTAADSGTAINAHKQRSEQGRSAPRSLQVRMDGLGF